MNTQKVTRFFKGIQRTVSKHSPEILTGIGIAGMVTTTVLAVKATPKALMLIEDAQYEKKDTLTAPEKAKAVWKCYIPAAVTGAFSIACLIGAQSVNARRTAALATAYKLSETALAEFKEAAVDVIGEEKVKEVKQKIAKDKMDKDPVSAKEVIITGNGNILCYDTLSCRYFESNMESIRAAVNNINERLLCRDYVSLNEFYDELKLDRCGIGDNIGWNITKDGLVEVDYSSVLAKDGRPCLAIDYQVEPKYEYSKMW